MPVPDYVKLLGGLSLEQIEELRAAIRSAYEGGRGDGYTAGYLAAIADVKRTDRDLVRALAARSAKWYVRGQRRTRATFGDPHPADYPGMLP